MEMSGQPHSSAALLPGTYSVGGWVGHGVGLGVWDKR
jgi:hypothetical protein